MDLLREVMKDKKVRGLWSARVGIFYLGIEFHTLTIRLIIISNCLRIQIVVLQHQRRKKLRIKELKTVITPKTMKIKNWMEKRMKMERKMVQRSEKSYFYFEI